MTSCPTCDAETQPGQNFCSNCGQDLRDNAPNRRLTPDRYTPSHLADRIREDRHSVVGERKQVTVMFADIVDSTAAIQGSDPEEAANFLNAALEGMMAEIHNFEGTVNELRGDGLMALFGAPIAHEDHAVRAAQAALAIPEGVSRATDGRAMTRVGLHSGEVLVRGVGNDLSIEYQALGPTVHVAARMESLAEPGTSYITQDTHQLIEGRVDSRHIGAMEVKGISDPLDVYELSRVVDTSPWEARATRGLTLFTGRGTELATLKEALGASVEGEGRVVALNGGAGVGKSRLVHELVDLVDTEAVTLLRTDASPYESKTAYYPIKQLLGAWMASNSADGENQPLGEALADISLELVELEAVFGSLLDIGDHAEWDSLPAPIRRRDTRAAIALTLRLLAEQRPVVAIIEDLHWIDSETEAVIEEAVELAANRHLSLVLTYRPEFEPAWAGAGHVEEILVEPLGESATMSFLECLLGDDESLDAIKPLMATRAEGVPLFLEEMVRSLAGDGVLEGEMGAYRAKLRPDDVEIPDTVHSVIAARIDRLPEDDKTVLEIASVIGDSVPVPLAAKLLHMTEQSTLVSLQRLEEGDFLRSQQSDSPHEFGFAHALIRDVAYSSLPMAERRSMHTEMVAVLEQQSGTQSVERLAYHAMRGEMWREAVNYSLEAADRAISKSAFREASAFLRDATKALANLPTSDDVVNLAIDTRMRLRVAETGAAGGLKRLVSDLDEAAELAESHEDRHRRALIAIHAGYTANMLGDAVEADRHARIASETAREIGDEYIAMESQLLLAQSLLYSGRLGEVLGTLEPHLDYLTNDIRHETMDQTMVRSVVATCHNAVALAANGSRDEALGWVNTAEEISREAERPFDLMYSHFARGKCLSFLREPGAIDAHEESERVADENGIWFMKTFARPWYGHALLRAGRVDEAMSLLRATEAAAVEVELPFTEAEARAFAAIGAKLGGDDPTDDATFAIEFGDAHGNPILAILGNIALGDEDRAARIAKSNGLVVWASELERGTWFEPL